MRPLIDISLAAIELAVSIAIAIGSVAALRTALRRGASPARTVMAQYVLWALNLMLAISLLRLIGLESWADIGSFAMIFGIRLLVKWSLTSVQS